MRFKTFFREIRLNLADQWDVKMAGCAIMPVIVTGITLLVTMPIPYVGDAVVWVDEIHHLKVEIEQPPAKMDAVTAKEYSTYLRLREARGDRFLRGHAAAAVTAGVVTFLIILFCWVTGIGSNRPRAVLG